MTIIPILTPGLAIKTYVIIDESSKKAAVIDPTREVEPILEILKQNQSNLEYILETHVHADFLSGSKELKSRLDQKPIIACSSLGGIAWTPKYADKKIQNNDVFNLGSIKLQALHTPGHTPEHVSYLLIKDNEPTALFTGDLLFVGSVGRPDLLGQNEQSKLSHELYNSLFNILSELPDHLVIHPAHGAGSLCGKSIATDKESTLSEERKTNPFLQKQEEQTWISNLLKNMPKAPHYFPLLKQVNVKGAAILKEKAKPKQLTALEVDQLDPKQNFFLDIRNQEQFAKQHIQGSINIPWGMSFNRWMGEFIPYDQRILVISKEPQEAVEAIKALQLIGLDNLLGFTTEIENSGHLSSFPMATKKEIQDHLNEIQVIDVRTDAEWNTYHIPNAKHFEVNALPLNLNQLPKDKKLAFICGSGYRASIAASLAKKHGFTNVCNIKGGMQAWYTDAHR